MMASEDRLISLIAARPELADPRADVVDILASHFGRPGVVE